jgi:gamma-glutamylcyclotransferase (GGCT)/AIG2-like uncharacterized protein YtfP
MKLYIAYGSNLNLSQMAYRCPSAKIYGTGILNNWELLYKGHKNNSHATIGRKKGKKVPVLVWEITPSDEHQLDIYEGFPTYYYKQNIMVTIGGQKKKAMVYIMNKSRKPGKPSKSYIDTIYQGYVDNSFDLRFLSKSLETNAIECNKNM